MGEKRQSLPDVETIEIDEADLMPATREPLVIEIDAADLRTPDQPAEPSPFGWTKKASTAGKAAVDIILLIDTSGSMGATDYQPNRLEAAREAARLFARRKVLQGYRDHVGIIGFGGGPTTVCPLTENLDAVTAAIDKLQITHTGTMIGAALTAAYAELKKHNSPRQGIELLSDGGDEYDTSKPETVAGQHKHIKLFTIGMGTTGGGMAKLPHGKQMVHLNEKLLKQLAELSGGQYLYAPNVDELRKVYQALADY
jgi:Ca-activated chloride channel family protein